MEQLDNQDNRDLYKRVTIRGILAVVCILFFIFAFPRILSMLLPFVLAFIMAAILNPFVDKTTGPGKIPRRLMAAVLSVTVFLLVFSILGLIVYGIGKEIASLAIYIQQNWNEIVSSLSNLGEKFAELARFLPFQTDDLLNSLEESAVTFLKNASEGILNTVISGTTAVTTKTGSIIIGFVITVLGSFFIISEYNGLLARARKRISKNAGEFLGLMKKSILSALGGYVRSQFLLALFAFVFMFIALLIYRQPYALLIALLLGLIDLLPIVGTVAVLVPWGIIEWIGGDMNKGLFLIILGIAYFLIRKVVEPKVVGSQTGLHPLATLISIYVGLKLSGIWGAILGPMVLMLILSIAKSGIFDRTIADIKALNKYVSIILKGDGK